AGQPARIVQRMQMACPPVQKATAIGWRGAERPAAPGVEKLDLLISVAVAQMRAIFTQPVKLGPARPGMEDPRRKITVDPVALDQAPDKRLGGLRMVPEPSRIRIPDQPLKLVLIHAVP